MGLEVGALKEGEDVIEPLAERIVGNVAAEDIEDPHETNESGRPTMLAEAGQLIDEETAQHIEDSGLETVKIRSVLTCEAKRGLCRMCYGRNLATMAMVDIGEAVGIIAAQSIGEPGTSSPCAPSTSAARRLVSPSRRRGRARWRGDRVQRPVGVRHQPRRAPDRHGLRGRDHHPQLGRSELGRRRAPAGAARRDPDDEGRRGGEEDQVIFTWDPYSNPIIADVEGTIRFVDLVEDESVSEELDELTGLRQRVVIEDREKKLHPHIEIWQSKGGKEKKSATSSSRWARSSRSRTAVIFPGDTWRSSAAKRTRPAISRAVCRASRSCSRRASRRIRRPSPRSMASSGLATSSGASARSSCTRSGRHGRGCVHDRRAAGAAVVRGRVRASTFACTRATACALVIASPRAR